MAAPTGYSLGYSGFYHKDDGSGPYWLDALGVIHTFAGDASAAISEWNYAPVVGGIANTATATVIKTAAGVGIRNYLTGLQIATDTLGAATELAIRDGAGGTVLWRTKLATALLPSLSIQFSRPLRGTANTLLEIVTLTASITGGVFVNAQGFTGL